MNSEKEFDRLNKGFENKNALLCFDRPEDFSVHNLYDGDSHEYIMLFMQSCENTPGMKEPYCKNDKEKEKFLNKYRLVTKVIQE